MKFNQAFSVGSCQVIPIEYAIKFDGQVKQSLQPKFIEVLCYLANNYPRVIPRDELIENVWGNNSYVGEKALTNAIWHLRQNLKGANGEEEVIETIRKVGYRLLVAPLAMDDEKLTTVITNQENSSNNNKYKKVLAVVAFSIISIWLLFHLIMDEKVPRDTVVKAITKEPGGEFFPAASPDGRYIVYKWLTADRPGNLFIYDTFQPELAAKQLTFGKKIVGIPVWSNDGDFLYYTQKNVEGAYCDVLQLKINSKQINKIADCPFNVGYSYIDISPDDQILAFRGYTDSADENGIYFISLKDKDSKPYRFSCENNCGYEDRDFAFSPDGESIAVTRRVNRFNENIFLVNLKTKQGSQLTFGEEDIVGLTWHPSGEKLVYGAQRADVRSGYVINIFDRKITPLAVDGFSYPNYAKQSAQLYYQQRDEKYHLASLSLDQSVASSPFPVIQSDFNHHYPDYSPVSNKIVYVSNESGFYELWVADVNGRNRKQLTNLQQTLRYPSWSHDGTRIAFLAPGEDKGSDQIYILDINSEKLSILPSPYSEHNRPSWSFDDKAIISAVYDHEYTDLHYISIDDGSTKRVTFDGGRYGKMTSDTTLLYTTSDNGLWQKDLYSNEDPVNMVEKDIFNATYSWTYHDNGVFYSQNNHDSHNLAYYDFDKAQQRAIVRLPLKTFSSNGAITYLPSLNKLIFALSHFPQADIKLLEHYATE